MNNARVHLREFSTSPILLLLRAYIQEVSECAGLVFGFSPEFRAL